MVWFYRFLMFAIIAAGCTGGWYAGGLVARDIKVVSAVTTENNNQLPRLVTGSALSLRVTQALASINMQRESRKDGDLRAVVLEKVSFERSSTGVIARGSIIDLGGPRRLNGVLDAFDAGRRYITSATSPLFSTQATTSFSVMLADDESYRTFAIRFLDEHMEEVVMRSAELSSSTIPPLMSDDPVHAADMAEVAERLAHLGYAEKIQPACDEVVASALIAHFRRDYGIAGPAGVTIGDLLALRSVSGPVKHQTDLTNY